MVVRGVAVADPGGGGGPGGLGPPFENFDLGLGLQYSVQTVDCRMSARNDLAYQVGHACWVLIRPVSRTSQHLVYHGVQLY